MTLTRVITVIAGVLLAAIATAQQAPLIVGPNINMVSGTTWPGGDPFLRQQNEPTVAFSSRNKLHLLSGANDYRTVDIPGDFEAGATGDSWLSYFWTTNGGGTWKSDLIPGYPQDNSPEGLSSPLKGYSAGADPVIRAGTHGLFYYSGIVFERSENPGSAIFVSRFIDLNNDEGGDPIRFIDTMLVDVDTTGQRFLDKSWIGVDLPRPGAATKTFDVTQRDGSTVMQEVSCGHVYVAYAALTGDGDTLRSEIMLTRSTNCGDSWSAPQPISAADTLNQGANIAINPGNGNVHIGWRRFDTVEAFLGASAVGCAKELNEWKRKNKKKKAVEWPVQEIDVGDLRLTRDQALDLMSQPNDDKSVKLAKKLVVGKLNLLSGGGQPSDTFDPAGWTRTLNEKVTAGDEFFRDHPLQMSGESSNPGKGKAKGKKNKDANSGQEVFFDGESLSNDERKRADDLRKELETASVGSDDCVVTAAIEGTTTGATNAMVATVSVDGGASFGPPVDVAEIRTFDQGGTQFSFRTTAYPSLAVDALGRLYMAYAARGFANVRPDIDSGDSRIVMSISNDGGNSWQAPYAIDNDPLNPGHQIKPSLLFAGGKLLVLFYDLRQDVSGLFEQFVVDVPEPDRLRHTLDVRAATALTIPAPQDPEFTSYDVSDRRNSQQASRYAFLVTGNNGDQTIQLQYMVPNLPTHAGGTQPFIGDYVDVAAKVFINDNGVWRYATEPGDVDVYQAVWTDNRDIVAPEDGDWTNYIAPNVAGQSGERISVFDGSTIAACESPADALLTGTRNQNVYSALLTDGLIVASPGSNRPLGFVDGELLQRSYVVFTQNVTAQDRFFRLSVAPPAGGEASFDQFEPLASVDVAVGPFSSTVKTVFASSTIAEAAILVVVQEIDAGGAVLGGGLVSTVLLNGDPTAPLPLDNSLLTAETYTPTILNPTILNPTILNPTILNPTIFNPTILNPTIFNPTIFNPTIFNPTIFNPTILNPTIFNPTILNPTILNPTILNPTILNPTILNPTILNPTIFNTVIENPTILNPTILNTAVAPNQEMAEVTFVVRNDGTATGSYDIDLASTQGSDDGLTYQVMVFRLNKTPVAEGCDLVEEAQQELIANVFEPGNILDPDGGNGTASFYLEPRDEVFVTIRVMPDYTDPNPGDPDGTTLDLSVAVTPQAVNTEEAAMGETEPEPATTITPVVIPLEIDTSTIPDGQVDVPYSTTLVASGGVQAATWSFAEGAQLPPGLSLSSGGTISGTPTTAEPIMVAVRATDGIQQQEAFFTATIVGVIVAGGGGGSPWSLDCPTGHVAIGLRGNAGDDIDATELVCAVVTDVTGGYPDLGAQISAGFSPDGGGGGSNYGNALMCAAGEVLVGLQVRAGNAGFGVIVDQLGVRCQSAASAFSSSGLQGVDGSGAPLLILQCPADTFVLGLTGRSGLVMDQVGIACGAAAAPFVAATLAPKYYVVAVANPGFTPRGGSILEFTQSPQTGTTLTFDGQTGIPDNQGFTWAVDEGKLVLTYDAAVISTGLDFDANTTTATPAQIILLSNEAVARGNAIVIGSTVSTTETAYTRVIDGVVDVIEKEDTQDIVYDPINLWATGQGILQLDPITRTETTTDTLREESTTPGVALSDNCAANDGSVCVQGKWGGTYRYAPGTRYWDGYVYPATDWGEVLTFTDGATQDVTGTISAVAATWSVVDERLVIDYGDGWTQTVTIVDNMGIEYSVFSEYTDGQEYAF